MAQWRLARPLMKSQGSLTWRWALIAGSKVWCPRGRRSADKHPFCSMVQYTTGSALWCWHYLMEEPGSGDVHQTVCDTVHHHKFGVFSSLLECLPAEVRQVASSGRCYLLFDSHLWQTWLLCVAPPQTAGCTIWCMGPMLTRHTQRWV